jgi:hypothetical protein
MSEIPYKTKEIDGNPLNTSMHSQNNDQELDRRVEKELNLNFGNHPNAKRN